MRARDIISMTLALIVMVLAVACSRKEATKPEKKMQSFTVAPTPAVQLAVTNMSPHQQGINVVMMGTNEFVHHVKSTSTPETKRAMRERQKAFASQLIAGKIAKDEIVAEQAQHELEMKESEVRDKDPDVRDAYEKVLSARKEYEDACAEKIPGYSGLIQSSMQFRARLNECLLRRKQGLTVDMKEMTELRNNLNQACADIGKMLKIANMSDATVSQALGKVATAQSLYEQKLLKNDGYVQARRRSDLVVAEIRDLTSKEQSYKQE